MSADLIELLNQEKRQSEYGRQGLLMIQKARDLLEVDAKSFAQAKDVKSIEDLLIQTFQKFLNRVDAVLSGVRDENDLTFKEGIPWTEAAKKQKETT